MDNDDAKALSVALAELRQDIRYNRDGVAEMRRDIARIEKILLGNGEAGLLTRFKILEDSVAAHHSEYDELKKSRGGFFRWILEIFIAAAAALAAILQIKG